MTDDLAIGGQDLAVSDIERALLNMIEGDDEVMALYRANRSILNPTIKAIAEETVADLHMALDVVRAVRESPPARITEARTRRRQCPRCGYKRIRTDAFLVKRFDRDGNSLPPPARHQCERCRHTWETP